MGEIGAVFPVARNSGLRWREHCTTSTLDEATSAEKNIQNVIGESRDQNKTVILIAHRLSTVMRADKIIVLHEGSVAEEGTHEELLRANGIYARLWRDQFPV